MSYQNGFPMTVAPLSTSYGILKVESGVFAHPIAALPSARSNNTRTEERRARPTGSRPANRGRPRLSPLRPS